MRTLSAAQPRMGLLGVLALLSLVTACSQPEPPPEPVRAVKLLTVGASELQTVQEYACLLYTSPSPRD